MNLRSDPWIPVLYTDGRTGLVSLQRAFEKGEAVRDLNVRAHERIAMMRLLLGIAHAGLDGPEDVQHWKQCRNTLAKSALQHLAENQDTFELFGGGSRFCQLYSGTKYSPEHASKGQMTASKLELTLASGQNTTVFDNGAAGTRTFNQASLARMLLAYEACSPLIGCGYKGRSPCVEGNMLHTFLIGDNLIDTIWLNLLDRETVARHFSNSKWGMPVWLAMPESPKDRPAIFNATKTFLGRLVPLPRAIWLAEDCCTIAIRNGLHYPAWDGNPAEPTATVISSKGGKEPRVFAARLNHAVWRSLPALAARRCREDGQRGPLAWQRLPEDYACDFWVGGVVTDRRAKVLDMVDSMFTKDMSLGTDDSLRIYEGGVRYAEDWALTLEKGLFAYRSALGEELHCRRGSRRAECLRERAASHFWTAIEAAVRTMLVPLAVQPASKLTCGAPYFGDYDRQQAGWGPIVRRAAEGAFSISCAQGSARQAMAFGAARQFMLRRAPRTNAVTFSNSAEAFL